MSPAALVLNYRDAARTSHCVRNLLEQGASTVLVWDNSADGGKSSQATRDLLEGEANWHLVDAGTNLGFAAGVNRGLAWLSSKADPEAVLLLNNDARLLPGALSELTSALARHPDALVVHPTVDHAGTVIGESYYHRWLGLITRRRLPGAFAYPSGCCLLVNLRRLAGPLFNERYFMYGEDILLGYQLEASPGSRVHVAHTLVWHEGSASSGTSSLFYESRMSAAHLMLADDLASSAFEAYMMRTIHLLMLALRAAWRSIRRADVVAIRGLFKGLTLWRASRDSRQ